MAWQPTPAFWHGDPHGQKSLAGYSLWGRKELDTTEQLRTAQRLEWKTLEVIGKFRKKTVKVGKKSKKLGDNVEEKHMKIIREKMGGLQAVLRGTAFEEQVLKNKIKLKNKEQILQKELEGKQKWKKC